jgi:hypothetical protein
MDYESTALPLSYEPVRHKDNRFYCVMSISTLVIWENQAIINSIFKILSSRIIVHKVEEIWYITIPVLAYGHADCFAYIFRRVVSVGNAIIFF